MSGAGSSAEGWARQLRADARRGVWRRVLSMLGITAHTRRADAQAADCDAGAKGEQMTAALLAPLALAGWTVLHDRAIPGARKANADHVVVSPGARVFLVDSKLWSAKTGLVRVEGGRLWHGRRYADKAVDSLLFEQVMVSRALRAPVQPVVVVHNAVVAGGGFKVREVPVVPASRLVELLRANDEPVNPGALWLAQTAAAVLPPYGG
ncbi:MAG: NERD domain-containing protein [Streptomyces sp.]|nr:NERD domain-containing protein [Streptomyces sp.]